MGNCAKCGKGLSFLDKHKGGSETVLFHNALLAGLFSEYSEKEICCSCQRGLLDSKGIKYRGVLDFSGSARIKELSEQKKNEVKNGRFCVNCVSYYHAEHQKFEGILVPTVKVIQTNHCTKFDLKLETPHGTEAEKCTSYLTPKEYKEKALSGEMNKDKANVQIILDFSSLKDVMAKGGVVMTTYKCPNCNGAVKIPEAGKVLMCEYCGTLIKPVDIFDKIKSFVQSDVCSKPIPEHQQQSTQKNLCRKCSKPIDNNELSRNDGVCDDCWDTAKMKEDDLS